MSLLLVVLVACVVVGVHRPSTIVMSLELFYYGLLLLEENLDKPELSPEERKRRNRRTPRIALRKYSKSSFHYLFESGNDQALLNCCAVDHKVFRELLALFEPLFLNYSYNPSSGYITKLQPKSKWGGRVGRKRDMDAVGNLGLVLYWYRTRGSVASYLYGIWFDINADVQMD